MNELEIGDYVQWESKGVWMFHKSLRITSFSPCKRYAFVEGSNTGIPTKELKKSFDFGTKNAKMRP